MLRVEERGLLSMVEDVGERLLGQIKKLVWLGTSLQRAGLRDGGSMQAGNKRFVRLHGCLLALFGQQQTDWSSGRSSHASSQPASLETSGVAGRRTRLFWGLRVCSVPNR